MGYLQISKQSFSQMSCFSSNFHTQILETDVKFTFTVEKTSEVTLNIFIHFRNAVSLWTWDIIQNFDVSYEYSLNSDPEYLFLFYSISTGINNVLLCKYC